LPRECGEISPADFEFDGFSSQIIFAQLTRHFAGLFAQRFFECLVVTDIHIKCDLLTDGFGLGFCDDGAVVYSLCMTPEVASVFAEEIGHFIFRPARNVTDGVNTEFG